MHLLAITTCGIPEPWPRGGWNWSGVGGSLQSMVKLLVDNAELEGGCTALHALGSKSLNGISLKGPPEQNPRREKLHFL